MRKRLIEFARTHLVIIIAFIALSLAYFSPILEGKVLSQNDMNQSAGMGQELRQYHEETGEYAQWTNSIFGGMPAFHVGPYGKKTTIFGYIGEILTFGVSYSNPFAVFFLYLLGFYIFLISLGIKPWQGMIGAVAFAFSSYNIIILTVGHVTKAYAIAYMAPALGGMLLVYNKKYLPGTILFLISLGLEIRSNHLQITYYLMMMMLVIVLTRFVFAIREKQLKSFLTASSILLVTGLLAILPNVSTLWVNYAIADQTTRGPSELTVDQEDQTSGLDKSYALSWSYGRTETLSLMIPNIRGGGSGPLGNNERAIEKADPAYREALKNVNQYWGSKSGTAGPVYAGAILVFLFVLGLLLLRGPFFWWILVTTLLSVFLAWGRHFPGLSNFFLDHVPLYNKFRTVEMILVIASLNIPLMGMVMLKKIIDEPGFLDKNRKKFLIAFGLTGGLSLLFFLFPGIFNYLTSDEQQSINAQIAGATPQVAQQYREFVTEIENARQNILKFDAVRSFFFISCAFLLIWFFIRKKLSLNYFLIGLGALILIDLWGVDRRYLNKDNFLNERQNRNTFSPSAADQAILADNDPDFRVLNLTRSPFQDAITSYYHKSIGGYHGAKLKRYDELIQYQLMGNINNIVSQRRGQSADTDLQSVLSGQQILNMLNTKYIIWDPSQLPIVNNHAFGHAWFVSDVQIVANADEEILSLGNVDLETTALVDQRYASLLSPEILRLDSISGSIQLTDYAPGSLRYESSSKQDQLAVFSEIYYEPGWQVTIDGKPAELVRANYVLRALDVPEGDHIIEMKFEFQPFVKGEKISLTGSILVLIMLLSAIAYGIRQSGKQESGKQESA